MLEIGKLKQWSKGNKLNLLRETGEVEEERNNGLTPKGNAQRQASGT